MYEPERDFQLLKQLHLQLFFSVHFLLLFPIHKNMEDAELRFSNNIPLELLGLLPRAIAMTASSFALRSRRCASAAILSNSSARAATEQRVAGALLFFELAPHVVALRCCPIGVARDPLIDRVALRTGTHRVGRHVLQRRLRRRGEASHINRR